MALSRTSLALRLLALEEDRTTLDGRSRYELTDAELREICGLPPDATTEELMQVARGEHPARQRLPR